MAGYFSSFTKIPYVFNVKGVDTTFNILDISKNDRFRKDFFENVSLYDWYDILDGQTPELIADMFYGSPDYHWIVMLFNQKLDNQNDFPLSSVQFEQHITNIYGSTIHDLHHYEDINGIQTDIEVFVRDSNGHILQYPFDQHGNTIWLPQMMLRTDLSAVSNYEYEHRKNEAKRRIKILHADVFSLVIKSLTNGTI